MLLRDPVDGRRPRREHHLRRRCRAGDRRL